MKSESGRFIIKKCAFHFHFRRLYMGITSSPERVHVQITKPGPPFAGFRQRVGMPATLPVPLPPSFLIIFSINFFSLIRLDTERNRVGDSRFGQYSSLVVGWRHHSDQAGQVTLLVSTAGSAPCRHLTRDCVVYICELHASVLVEIRGSCARQLCRRLFCFQSSLKLCVRGLRAKASSFGCEDPVVRLVALRCC